MPLFLQRADARFFVRGQHIRDRFRDTKLLADGLCRQAIIPGEHHYLKTHCLKLPDCRAARFTNGIRHSNHAAYRTAPCKQKWCFARCGKALNRLAHGIAVHAGNALLTQERSVARKNRFSCRFSTHAAPGNHLKPIRRVIQDALVLCLLHHSSRQRMFAAGFCACSFCKEFALRHARSKNNYIRDCRMAGGDGSRLIQNDGVHRM